MTVTRNDERSRYELETDGTIAGFLVYREEGDVLDLVHTEVGDEWEGRGVGSTLVREALDDVRERGLKIRPTCPFVAAFVKRHPAYEDLLAS